jgi:hypothetical protein
MRTFLKCAFFLLIRKILPLNKKTLQENKPGVLLDIKIYYHRDLNNLGIYRTRSPISISICYMPDLKET